MVNLELLNEEIRKAGVKKCHLAEKCGITRQAFAKKLKSPKGFNLEEAAILCRELHITRQADRERIFFA